jgi:hypothetical protein
MYFTLLNKDYVVTNTNCSFLLFLIGPYDEMGSLSQRLSIIDHEFCATFVEKGKGCLSTFKDSLFNYLMID